MDLRLIALLDAGTVPLRALGPWLEAARAGGVTGIQLRDKSRSTREVYAYGRHLAAVARSLGLWLAVDDRPDLAMALGADLVHLGRTDLPPEAARRAAPSLPLGLSASDLAEVAEAQAHAPVYIGFGPVFPTPSKADAAPPAGLPLLAQAVRASARPVVAIGGIRPGNADAVWAQGVAGVAVLSALAEAEAPSEVHRRARALVRGAPPRAGEARR
ncbi:MAG: thiamine phosphate synthase [Firmicutes bacterium]|nr:thiamine phosphate synthase [Bacillota bacterium]